MATKEEKEAQKEAKRQAKEAKQLQKARLKTARELRKSLLNFARDERFAIPLATALPIYWNNYYDIETAAEMDMNESLRFFDWFLFDYKPEDQPSLIDVYYDEQRGELTELQQEILEDWRNAPPAGAYEFLDFDGFSQRFKLRDVFGAEDSEPLLVYTAAGTGQAKRGDTILARIVPVGEDLEFTTVGAYIPKEEMDEFEEFVAAAKAEYAKDHPDATHDQFMRDRGYVLIHYALQKSEEKGRNPVSRLNPSLSGKAARVVQRSSRQMARKLGNRKV